MNFEDWLTVWLEVVWLYRLFLTVGFRSYHLTSCPAFPWGAARGTHISPTSGSACSAEANRSSQKKSSTQLHAVVGHPKRCCNPSCLSCYEKSFLPVTLKWPNVHCWGSEGTHRLCWPQLSLPSTPSPFPTSAHTGQQPAFRSVAGQGCSGTGDQPWWSIAGVWTDVPRGGWNGVLGGCSEPINLNSLLLALVSILKVLVTRNTSVRSPCGEEE